MNDGSPRRMFEPPRAGRYPCARSCGQRTELPGLCEACALFLRIEDADAVLAPARTSIPETFRWASANDPALAQRVALHGKDVNSLVGRMVESMLDGSRLLYVIRGPNSGPGKTSLACAVLTSIIDTARSALLEQSQIVSDRRGVSPGLVRAEPRAVYLGRAARFYSEVNVMPPREIAETSTRSTFSLALEASILVVDDLGKVSGARADAAQGSNRREVTTELIDQRWNRGAPTIVTTFLTNEQLVAMYDGGIYRRGFTDDRGRVIECGR